MLGRFHHFTELNKNFGNKTSLATIYILKYNNCISYLKSIRDLQSYNLLNFQNIAKRQFQAVVFQCAAAGETKGRTINFLPEGSYFGKPAHKFLAIQQFQTIFFSFYSCEQYFNKKIYEFLHKRFFFAYIKGHSLVF